MERRLAIFELTPKAAAEGSRMSSVLLSLKADAQRAKSAVAHFPSDPEDPWKMKMRPEKGTEPKRLCLKAPAPRGPQSEPSACAGVLEEEGRGEGDRRQEERERKENHEKVCARAKREGLSPPTTPESTEEEDSLTGGVDFSESEDFEAVTAESPPPAPQRADVEATAPALGERRFALATLGKGRRAPAMLERVPASRTDRRSPAPAAGRGSPTAAGRVTPAPAAATGGRTSASATSAGGRTSAASAETLRQTAPRVQVDRGAKPSGQSSGSGSAPRDQRSSTGKRRLSSLSDHRAATRDAVSLAPIMALKSGVGAMLRSASQPPTGGSQTLEMAAAALQEAMARGA
ncbi:skin secretory protein xP2-like [Panicum virgatum]|uniref:skin secretory protein xP2-like n=1 Tax=Panicum virgatum TaxID=38727 RepID=UPI0019D4FE61|nr:skin secretory protein xP2-like [Panicum virgatum]